MTRQHQSALSRLGFRDPDKEPPRHGLACEYLQQKMRPYVITSLVSRYIPMARKQLDATKLFKADGVDRSTFIRADAFTTIPESISGDWFDAKPVDPMLFRDAADQCIGQWARDWAETDAQKAAELSSLVTGPNSGAKGFLDVSFRGRAQSWYVAPETVTGRFVTKPCPFSTPPQEPQEFVATMELAASEIYYSRPTLPSRTPAASFCYWGEVRIEPTSPELLLQQIEFYASNLSRNDMIWVLADFDLSDFKRMATPQFPQLKCFQLGSNFEEWCQARERPEIPEL